VEAGGVDLWGRWRGDPRSGDLPGKNVRTSLTLFLHKNLRSNFGHQNAVTKVCSKYLYRFVDVRLMFHRYLCKRAKENEALLSGSGMTLAG
jgi:hypothetical protein